MALDGGTNSVSTVYHGRNFAPVAPLTDAKKTVKDGGSSSMSAFFREIYQEIDRQDEQAWREAVAMGRIIANFRAGKLIMKRDLQGDGIVFLPRLHQGDQDRSNYPVFPQISEDLKSKWMKAQPTLEARHFGDGYKTEIQLNTVNKVVKSYFKDIFDAFYEANEALSAQDFGTYATRFDYDKTLNQIVKLAPVLQKQSRVLVDGYGGCYECGFEGEPKNFLENRDANFPQCPKCGSYRTTKMLDPTVVDDNQIVGVEEIVQGDITGRLLNFPAYKHETNTLAHLSSYFRLKERIPRRLAMAMCGDDLELGASRGGVDDYGLDVIASLAARGSNENSLYGGGSSFADDVTLVELWLKPEWYRGFKLDHTEKTFGGTIPKGVRFEEIFPEGLCVTGFNDLHLQTGIYAEKTNVVSGVYFVQSFSGIGKGMSDGIGLAKDMNELHSMAMAGIKRYGAAGVYYDSKTVTPGKVKDLFNPRKAVPIDLSKAGLTDIRQAVGQVQFSPINNVLPQYGVQLSNLLNLVNLSGDFSEGSLQSVDINTLGGQQLATAKEEGKKGAILSMKVFHRQKSAEIITDLFRRFIRLPRYFASGTDRHSATKGKWVAGADLPPGIKFDAVADSELPQNAFEKRSNAREMVDKAGGLGNLMMLAQQDPRLTAWYASQFNTELPMLNQEEIWLVCLARVESIKENSKIFANPEECLAQIVKPPTPRESGHQMKAAFISDLMDDDEVDNWNPVARAAVQMLIEAHYDLQAKAQITDELRKQRAQMMVQVEGQKMQAEMMQPQIEEQKAQIAADKEEAVIGQAAQTVIDDEKEQISHERALERDEANHARAIEIKQMETAAQPKQLKGK
ncbi:MAG TPA: hypothetical protein VNI84_12145 [Pyrinomonadaceae bacterium]|nr:hypothetical protein [Pyrinomonadaceae bacterium]